jgi:type IV pilus assembly protein PilN
MIKINLLPEAKVALARKPAVIPSGISAENFNNYIIIGFLVLGVLIGGWLWFSNQSKKIKLQAKVQSAREQAAALKPYIDQVNDFEKRKAKLEAKLKLITDLRSNQEGPVHILDELASLVPDLLWLTSINLKGNTMEIKGNAFNPSSVAEFLQRLDESPYFDEPSLKEMKEAKDYNSFSLTVNFSYTPREEVKKEEKVSS